MNQTETFKVTGQGNRLLVRGLLLSILVCGAVMAGVTEGEGESGGRFFVPFLLIAMALTSAFAVAMFSEMTTITVGVDGVWIKQAFRKPRFVPHHLIREATANGAMVTVVFGDGKMLQFECEHREGESVEVAYQAAEAIVATVRAGRAAFDELAGERGDVRALARAERTTKEWVAALRRIADGEGAGYREGPVPRERLLRIAASAQVPEESRLAAAVALSLRATEKERERLLTIASASASPRIQKRLRVAVDFADAPAALEKMLDEAAADETDADDASREAHRSTAAGSNRER